MIIPNAEQIEGAADSLVKGGPTWGRADQQKELDSFGAERAKTLGASGLSDDFRRGYELGIQAARTVVAGSVIIAIKNIDPRDVL